MKILIQRSQDDMKRRYYYITVEDRITLDDLLVEAGYNGKFDVTLVDATEDDFTQLSHLVTVTV